MTVKERPILFNAPMVRAILDGSKTQTRRALKLQPWDVATTESGKHIFDFRSDKADLEKIVDMPTMLQRCPYGQPGDRLWVRESFAHVYCNNIEPMARSPEDVAYMADNMTPDRGVYGPWKPSIHMPRWASRITLEVTGVRVERLQDISEADCWAEGIEQVMNDFPDSSQIDTAFRLGLCIDDAKPLYAQLWESINGPGSWDANPWVWVVEFRSMA